MEKRKYPKIYKSSEVSLKQVGKFEIRGMVLPYGTPLYTILNSKKEVIYPLHFKILNKGESKDRCENWIRDNCRAPEDKPFRKSLLNKLMGMENGQKLGEITIIDNEARYHGERHAEFSLVFKQGEEHYRFGYVDYYGLNLGTWQGRGLHINQRDYLCKRVYPKERTVKITDFVTR